MLCFAARLYLLVTAGAQIKAYKQWWLGIKKRQRKKYWGVYCLLFLLLVCKRSTPHLCSKHFHSDKKQWSFKMNKGIGSVLRITDAGKGSWVWERRERIMNFSKSEESLWRNLSVALCFFLSSFLPPFHSLILSPSLLCLYLELLCSLI